jgi:hypothetical protein
MRGLVVMTKNPQALDTTLQQLGAVVMQNPDGSYMETVDGHYYVRPLNDNTGFISFAIKNQGYGTVIMECEIPCGV